MTEAIENEARDRSSCVFVGAVAIAIALLGLLVWRGGCVAELLGLQDRAHESDSDLIETFQRHRAEFEHLKQMIVRDKGLFVVRSNRTLPKDPGSVGISASRIDEYRKMMKDLGIHGSIEITMDRTSIRIVSSGRGFVTHSSEKGYIYAAVPFKKGVVAELDSLSSRGKGAGLRRIEENWYLFFEGY